MLPKWLSGVAAPFTLASAFRMGETITRGADQSLRPVPSESAQVSISRFNMKAPNSGRKDNLARLPFQGQAVPTPVFRALFLIGGPAQAQRAHETGRGQDRGSDQQDGLKPDPAR